MCYILPSLLLLLVCLTHVTRTLKPSNPKRIVESIRSEWVRLLKWLQNMSWTHRLPFWHPWAVEQQLSSTTVQELYHSNLTEQSWIWISSSFRRDPTDWSSLFIKVSVSRTYCLIRHYTSSRVVGKIFLLISLSTSADEQGSVGAYTRVREWQSRLANRISERFSFSPLWCWTGEGGPSAKEGSARRGEWMTSGGWRQHVWDWRVRSTQLGRDRTHSWLRLAFLHKTGLWEKGKIRPK